MLGTLGITTSIVFTFDFSKVLIDVLKDKCLNVSFENILFLILLFATVSSILYGSYKLINSLAPRIYMNHFEHDEMLCNSSIKIFSSIATHKNYTKFLNALKGTNDTNGKDYLSDISSQISFV